jgi:hypothetical protein
MKFETNKSDSSFNGFLDNEYSKGCEYISDLLMHMHTYQNNGWKTGPLEIRYFDEKKIPFFPKDWISKDCSFNDFRDNHNGIYIKTGVVSNLMVIDIDLMHDELNECVEYFALESIISRVPCVKTPGGEHIYLSNLHHKHWKNKYGKDSLTTTNKSLHVDIRENGACVFAPPTIIQGYGSYTWSTPNGFGDLDYDVKSIEKLMDAIFMKDKEPRVSLFSRSVINHHDYCSNWAKAEQAVAILSTKRIDYSDWIKIGMALYAGFGENGKVLWDMFLHNPNYQEKQWRLDTHWRSFACVHSVTLASLFYIAEQYGVKL